MAGWWGSVVARWTVSTIAGWGRRDGKEVLGLDQHQVMSAEAIVRFWTLAWAASAFLDEERACLRARWQRHVTWGEARREVQRGHWRQLIMWLHQQFVAGATPQTMFERLAA